MSRDYRNLIVWQKAIELTVCVYKFAQCLPKEELFGLVSQMRRAAVSVASNIAEGRGRLNPGEFRQFPGVAQGSLYELQTQLLVARRLKMAPVASIEQAETLSNEVSKMLGSFIQRLSSETKARR